MTPEAALLEELYQYLQAAHARYGLTIDRIHENLPADYEVHRCGRRGVLAFIGDYVLVAMPDPRDVAGSREVYRLLAQRLEERGVVRHMVHPLNFASVKSTRRLGARPVGYDSDGYMHYVLTPATFRPFERFRPHATTSCEASPD